MIKGRLVGDLCLLLQTRVLAFSDSWIFDSESVDQQELERRNQLYPGQKDDGWKLNSAPL